MNKDASLIFLDYAISHPSLGFDIKLSAEPVLNQEIIAVTSNNSSYYITILDVVTNLGYTDTIIPSDIVIISPDINTLYSEFLADDAVSSTDKDIVRATMDPLLANKESLAQSYNDNFLTPLFENYNIEAAKIYITILPNGPTTSSFYTSVITLE